MQLQNTLSEGRSNEVLTLHTILKFEDASSTTDEGGDAAILKGRTSPCDIVLVANTSGNAFKFHLLYCPELFTRASAERMRGTFVKLLHEGLSHTKSPCDTLPLVDPSERRRLLNDFNKTKKNYPGNKCLHHLVEEQAKKTPSATALVFSGQKLSYAEMMDRAAEWSDILVQSSIGPGTMVAMLVERSLEMVFGLLAVLRAGGAYVPIDCAYPSIRVSHILEDTEAPVLLTQQRFLSKVIPPNVLNPKNAIK